MTQTGTLLTTDDAAALLRVHRKQVYRLIHKGMPARRVGGEWRFVREDVLRWAEGRNATLAPEEATEPGPPATTAPEGAPPSLLSANGDVVVEELLAEVEANGAPLLGLVRADRARSLAHLERGDALLAGSHGDGFPARAGGARLARIHLVDREVGIVTPAGRPLASLGALLGMRFAGRPITAGVCDHLRRALSQEGLSFEALQARATPHASHHEVVCAVARQEADAGIATLAWASRLGLSFRALASEAYGLLVKAKDLGDPRVVRLCELAQGKSYRQRLQRAAGYQVQHAGSIRYDEETR